jgi:hypothetical protein
MEASDGKMRVTDAADVQTLLRIIQSIPLPHAEPVKQWLAQVGTERLAEMEDPSLAVDRARQFYAAQGYDTDWIEKRLQGIVIRQELTDEWRDRGAQEGREFAILTDVLHRGAFGIKTEEHKVIKRLKRRDNLRDSMTPLELVLTSYEITGSRAHTRARRRTANDRRNVVHQSLSPLAAWMASGVVGPWRIQAMPAASSAPASGPTK